MPYTMTHILTAEKVLHNMGRKLDYPTYILGAIAPDAVHASQDFSVKLKERSHLFTEGLKWGKIGTETEAQLWLGNIKKFYLENRDKYNFDFLSGYIVHLLTDVYCSIHFYAPFVNSINSDAEEKMTLYKRENYIVNYYLFTLFSKEKNLLEILRSGRAETLDGVIEKEVIEQRIEQLFEFEFKYWDISHIEEQKLCRIDDMYRMIRAASLFIQQILLKGK